MAETTSSSPEMTSIYALPGDVFFTRGTSKLARLIQWAQSDPDEIDPTWANHTGVVVSPGWMVPPTREGHYQLAEVVESLWYTHKWAWWDAHKSDKDNAVRVYRKQDLTLPQVKAIETMANKFVGRKYGWWKLLAHLTDRIAFRGKKTVANFLVLDKWPICSYTAAQSFAAGDVFFGMLPNVADPDEMNDHVEADPSWVLVGESRTGGE